MASTLAARVAAVREFNRFYTNRIGVLGEGYLSSRFSVTEGRVLYELAHRGPVTPSELGRELGLDAGYLSRIVAAFVRRGGPSQTARLDDGRKGFPGRATV